MYSQNVINRFTNPKNAGHIKNADGVGTSGEANFSDVIKLCLQVENGVIKDAKFKAFGSVVAIAAIDALVDLIINKNIEDALKVTTEDVLKELGEVDENKFSSISVAVDSLFQAVEDYKQKQEKEEAKKARAAKRLKTNAF